MQYISNPPSRPANVQQQQQPYSPHPTLPNPNHQALVLSGIPQQVVPPQTYTPNKVQSQAVHLPANDTLPPLPQTPSGHGQRIPSSDDSLNEGHPGQNPWRMTTEQRQYYEKQFMEILPDSSGKMDGKCVYLKNISALIGY